MPAPSCRVLILILIGVVSSMTTLRAAAASFTGLGDFPGGRFLSSATDVSADGTVVVGSGTREGGRRGMGTSEAFRWTASTGLVGLGELPGGDVTSSAIAVSADGTFVVGNSFSDLGPEVFRWDGVMGMLGLGSSSPDGVFASARGISADGSIIIGQGITPSFGNQAFRWDAANGANSLGDLPGDGSYSDAAALSADGSVVVGYGSVDFADRPFRWDAINGMTELSILPGLAESHATGISADGTVVIGVAYIPVSGSLTTKSFRWDTTRGVFFLDDIEDPSQQVLATDVSADGSIIVGSGFGTAGVQGAAIWDEANGWRELDVVLATLGVDLTGWGLSYARAISADGRVIVGEGRNPNGDLEAWVAVIPEPGTALLFGMGLAGLSARRSSNVITRCLRIPVDAPGAPRD